MALCRFLQYMNNMYIYKQTLYTHTISQLKSQLKSKWQTADWRTVCCRLQPSGGRAVADGVIFVVILCVYNSAESW